MHRVFLSYFSNSARQLLTLGYEMIETAWKTGKPIEILSSELRPPFEDSMDDRKEREDSSSPRLSVVTGSHGPSRHGLGMETVSKKVEQRLAQLNDGLLMARSALLGKGLMDSSDSGAIHLLMKLPLLFLALFGIENESLSDESGTVPNSNAPTVESKSGKSGIGSKLSGMVSGGWNLASDIASGSRFGFQRTSSSWFKGGFVGYVLNFGRDPSEKRELAETITKLGQQVNKLQSALKQYSHSDSHELGELAVVSDVEMTLNRLLSFVGGMITQVNHNQKEIDRCYDNLKKGMKSLKETHQQFELAMRNTHLDRHNDLVGSKLLTDTALGTVDVISKEALRLMNHFDDKIRPQVMGNHGSHLESRHRIQNFASREYATLDGVFQHLNKMCEMLGLPPMTH